MVDEGTILGLIKAQWNECTRSCAMDVMDAEIADEDTIWGLLLFMTEEKRNEYTRLCALDVVGRWAAPEVVDEYLKTGNEKIRAEAKASASAWSTSWVDVSRVSCVDGISAARSAASAATRSASRPPSISAAVYVARSAIMDAVIANAFSTGGVLDYKKYAKWGLQKILKED
jgi:hypothetical protein